jgi:membrane fusion protein, multidrug efflux system
MRMRRAGLALLLAAAVLPPCGCAGRPDADDVEKAASAGAEPAAKEPGVTMSAEALALSPVKVAALQASARAPERQAFGVVVDTAPLFQAASAAAARRAELESARAALAASAAELARVTTLHDQGEDASARALEAAQAAERTDRARVAAAQAQLDAGWSELAQSWGPVITGWLRDGAPALQALAAGEERIVLVTLTGADAATAAAPEVSVEQGGRTWSARLISPSPRTDPALQGQSSFYRLSGTGPTLAAGLNVAVAVPTGAARAGVVVPEGAVVRWSGVRWVYRVSGPGHFERVALTDAQPVEGGLFVTSGLAAGEEIAVAGAAVLLSQELIDLGLAAPGGEE